MGDVLIFRSSRRVSARHVADGPAEGGEVVFFTGVRIEHWAEPSSGGAVDPAASILPPPRGRRGGARPGP